jgi:hypothetical protein
MTYPLARLGKSKAIHSLMPSGKTHCWSHFNGEPYSTRDVRPTGDHGEPDCTWCRAELGLPKVKAPDRSATGSDPKLTALFKEMGV